MSESVRAFYDASCPKCRRKIGWHGRVMDRPACPRCGHKPDAASLEHDQQEMDNFRDLLTELRKADPNWGQWQKARVTSGLSLRQAAKILEVEPAMLCDIEQGRQKPSQDLADRMSRCYSGD